MPCADVWFGLQFVYHCDCIAGFGSSLPLERMKEARNFLTKGGGRAIERDTTQLQEANILVLIYSTASGGFCVDAVL